MPEAWDEGTDEELRALLAEGLSRPPHGTPIETDLDLSRHPVYRGRAVNELPPGRLHWYSHAAAVVFMCSALTGAVGLIRWGAWAALAVAASTVVASALIQIVGQAITERRQRRH